MTTPNPRPVWGADVPISMPLPVSSDEPVIVDMYGMGMTQMRLVHSLTQREYENLSVPVYQPENPADEIVYDDADIEAAPPGGGMP